MNDMKTRALDILKYNARGPFEDLPRTAGWGYAEPYTRDLMICLPAVLLSKDEQLLSAYRRVLETLAVNQARLGQAPSFVHNSSDLGSSDCTPLLLLGIALYREYSCERDFLAGAVDRAFTWLSYQSPDESGLIAQQPTTDWRDEQWILGFGLFVNTLVYMIHHLFRHGEEARRIKSFFREKAIFDVEGRSYFAPWVFKVMSGTGFDLLGNSLAILSGLCDRERACAIISWVEEECLALRRQGKLVIELPPNFFPYINPGDQEWHSRYEIFNQPGRYHNGGIWPFICGFYIAALVAAEKFDLAERSLANLTDLVAIPRNQQLEFGFNEWFDAETGQPSGEDWQGWSAAMYYYAAICVETRTTPFFDCMRGK